MNCCKQFKFHSSNFSWTFISWNDAVYTQVLYFRDNFVVLYPNDLPKPLVTGLCNAHIWRLLQSSLIQLCVSGCLTEGLRLGFSWTTAGLWEIPFLDGFWRISHSYLKPDQSGYHHSERWNYWLLYACWSREQQQSLCFLLQHLWDSIKINALHCDIN